MVDFKITILSDVMPLIWYLSTELHSTTSQMIIILMLIATRTSNLIYYIFSHPVSSIAYLVPRYMTINLKGENIVLN
jgi:hypothetical protein